MNDTTHGISDAPPSTDDASMPPSSVILTPLVIADPLPSRYPKRICKSTKLQNFAYSCYSLSFTSFLASLHNLCEPTSYTEVVLDPNWEQAMAEELFALHRTDTWDLCHFR